MKMIVYTCTVVDTILSASELPVIKIILDLVKEVTQMFIKDSKI